MAVLGFIVVCLLACYFTFMFLFINYFTLCLNGSPEPLSVIPLAIALGLWYFAIDCAPFTVTLTGTG